MFYFMGDPTFVCEITENPPDLPLHTSDPAGFLSHIQLYCVYCTVKEMFTSVLVVVVSVAVTL